MARKHGFIELNPKFTLICGLPGSGKTYLARSMRGAFVIDDISCVESVKDAVINGHTHIVITDPHFCDTETRKLAGTFLKEFSDNIEWIFFENNPAQCLKNIADRNDGRKVENFISVFSKIYTIPLDAKILPVFVKI